MTRVIGMIGAGGIAPVHLEGWTALGHPVVVFSTDGQAPALAERYGARAVDSLDELLERAEIVDVCTPTDTHRELVERAAAAGRHVICEKPLALTEDDARAMIDACAAAGVRLFPAHVVRYFPAYAAARDAVARGDLGAVAVQRFSRGGPMPLSEWFWDEERSGGIAVDLMIHDLDLARWTAGPVASVYATRAGDGTPPVPTSVHAILTHASGAISHVNGVWGAETLRFRTRFQLAGPDGLVEDDSLAHPVLEIDGPPAAGTGYLPPVDPASSPYTAELADFAAATRSGGPSRVSAEDGLEALRIALDVNRSIHENRVIAREDVR